MATPVKVDLDTKISEENIASCDVTLTDHERNQSDEDSIDNLDNKTNENHSKLQTEPCFTIGSIKKPEIPQLNISQKKHFIVGNINSQRHNAATDRAQKPQTATKKHILPYTSIATKKNPSLIQQTPRVKPATNRLAVTKPATQVTKSSMHQTMVAIKKTTIPSSISNVSSRTKDQLTIFSEKKLHYLKPLITHTPKKQLGHTSTQVKTLFNQKRTSHELSTPATLKFNQTSYLPSQYAKQQGILSSTMKLPTASRKI